MKIAVFCSSRMGNRTEYREEAESLGRLLAEAGHELVYGGEEYGLMKVIADSVLDAGGRATGVIPNLPMIRRMSCCLSGHRPVCLRSASLLR